MEYYIEEDLNLIKGELKTKATEADVKRFIDALANKYGYNPDDFFVALTHSGKEEEQKDVLHYHRTGLEAALKIIASGALKGRNTRRMEGEDISKLAGGSSNRVQFTRDNEKGLGYSPTEHSLGAHDNDVVFIFDSNIFKESTYNPYGPYPSVEKLNLSDACVTILAKNKEVGEIVQRALQEKGLNVQVNLQEDFNISLKNEILENRKPQTPIQDVDYGSVDMPKTYDQKLAVAKAKKDALIMARQKIVDKQQNISKEYLMKSHSRDGWDKQLEDLELGEKMAYLDIKLREIECDIELCEADLDLLTGTIFVSEQEMIIEEIANKRFEDRIKNETKYAQIGLARANLQEKIGERDQDDFSIELAQEDRKKYEALLKKLSKEGNIEAETQDTDNAYGNNSEQKIHMLIEASKKSVTTKSIEDVMRKMLEIAKGQNVEQEKHNKESI